PPDMQATRSKKAPSVELPDCEESLPEPGTHEAVHRRPFLAGSTSSRSTSITSPRPTHRSRPAPAAKGTPCSTLLGQGDLLAGLGLDLGVVPAQLVEERAAAVGEPHLRVDGGEAGGGHDVHAPLRQPETRPRASWRSAPARSRCAPDPRAGT